MKVDFVGVTIAIVTHQDQPQHLDLPNYHHPHQQQQLLGLSHGRHTRSELFLLECGAGGLNSWGR